MPEQVCIAAANGLISFYAVLGDDIRSACRPIVGHGLDPSMDWIGSGFSGNFMDWIGLDWIHELMDWIGLGQQKWTHVQLCVGLLRAAFVFLA